jgi:hypothetical protein
MDIQSTGHRLKGEKPTETRNNNCIPSSADGRNGQGYIQILKNSAKRIKSSETGRGNDKEKLEIVPVT